MALGEKIRELREGKGWTQGQLALKSGVSRMEISHIEVGRRKSPSADNLAKLAKALDVSVDTLNEAAGSVTPRDPASAEIDDLSIYLSASGVDAKMVRQIRKLAETLIKENERDKGQ